MSNVNPINLSQNGVVEYGVGGQFSAQIFTSNAVLIGGSINPLDEVGPLTNGQILIGSTGTLPVAAIPSNASNIAWTVGAGSLTANVSGTTNHCVQIGNGGGAISSVPIGTTNTVLLGHTGADPSFGAVPTAALASSTITLLTQDNITVTGSPITLGGTGTITLSGTTQSAVQIGNSAGSLTSLAVANNGQLVIGSTGADPVVANLTSASGSVLITNGAGFIDLSVATSVLGAWSNQGGDFTATPGNGYFCNTALTVSLPRGVLNGDVVSIVSNTASAILIAADAIIFNGVNQTSWTISQEGAAMELRYYELSDIWFVTSSQGTWS